LRFSIIILLFIGTLLNCFTFETVEVLFILFFFIVSSFALLFFVFNLDSSELELFYFTFSFLWFISGITGLVDIFSYQLYLETDAYEFFEIASTNLKGNTLDDISRISTGSLAIQIWNYFYDFFGKINSINTEYIGKLVNVFFVSFSTTITYRIKRLFFSKKANDTFILGLLFSSSGLICMYGVLHLRDAFVLLLVTVILYFIILFFLRTDFKNFIFIFLIIIFSSYVMFYLRYEYILIPFILLGLGIFYKVVSLKKSWFKYAFQICFYLSIPILFIFTYKYYTELEIRGLSEAREAYFELATEESSSNSLGLIIASLPFPLNSIITYFFMLFGPVPFWVGLGLNSSYNLLKSLNAIYMYFTFPIFVLTVRRVIKLNSDLSYIFYYIISIFLLFSILISMSSADNRHLGAFMVPYILVCSLYFDEIVHSNAYRLWLYRLLFTILFIHVLWGTLKFIF
jgi:hypothetical protein